MPEHVSTPSTDPTPVPLLSFRIVGDNIDKTVKPRHMRVDHQATSLHHFSTRSYLIPASLNPNLVTVKDIDVSKFLPHVDDYTALKHNF